MRSCKSVFVAAFLLGRHKLLCCPVEWVLTIESEPMMNSTEFDPIFHDLTS